MIVASAVGTIGLLIGFMAAAGLGAVVRYGVGVALNREFPWGTLTVNLAASLLLGIVAEADMGDAATVVVGVGMLGALSTWSTVANEAAVMARDDEGRLALAYLALTVLSGIVMAWIGLQIGARLG